MLYAPLSNKGLARLEGPRDLTATTLQLIHEANPSGNDPDRIEDAFVALALAQLPGIEAPEQARALWRDLAHQHYFRVRALAQQGQHFDVVLSEPPVEHYRERYGWGGKREGAGKKPRRADGRMRIQKTITIDPDIATAVEAVQREEETYSEAVERLLAQALSNLTAGR
jgi:hypothetical protein